MGAQQGWLKKLSYKEQEELFINLARAIASVSSPTEAAALIKDIFTEAEIGMVAKRLAIAELLVGEVTYQEISGHLKVGYATIARVAEWLNRSGEGYRLALQRMKPARERDQEMRLVAAGARKGRTTMYNWPEKLLEEFMITATKKQRERIKEILNTSKEKTAMHRELERMIKRFN